MDLHRSTTCHSFGELMAPSTHLERYRPLAHQRKGTVKAIGFLPISQLREFFLSWTEVVSVVERVKSASPGGSLIQYPKIPQSVSESLAARFLIKSNTFHKAFEMRRGGSADIVVSCDGGVNLVEVKGSGSSEFQTFGQKDYACDLLLWLRFGAVRHLGTRSLVNATLFPKPSESIGNLGSRVVHSAAKAAALSRGYKLQCLEIALEELLR